MFFCWLYNKKKYIQTKGIYGGWRIVVMNRRKNPRIVTNLVAKIVNRDGNKIPLRLFKDGKLLGKGFLTDLSKGGIGFIYEGISLQERMELYVPIPSLSIVACVTIKHLLLIGEVYCIGAEFLTLSDENEKYISDIIEKAQK